MPSNKKLKKIPGRFHLPTKFRLLFINSELKNFEQKMYAAIRLSINLDQAEFLR